MLDRKHQLSTGMCAALHAGAVRFHMWDNANVMDVRGMAGAVAEPAHRAMVDEVLRDFETKVLPDAWKLRRGVLQNDANDQNIIVKVGGVGGGGGLPVATPVGVIDFGDIVVSWRVNDIAIAIAYFMLGKTDPVQPGRFRPPCHRHAAEPSFVEFHGIL